jgi:YbgC/YbaW family acyl-CoA thioester hydrolase
MLGMLWAEQGELMMQRSEFRFFDRLRVRWAEVDMQKIVFNGHYLMYFDTAVAGYWRAMAMPYHDTMHQLQGDLFVRKATVEYLASARYDDQLDTGLRCERIGHSSLQFIAAVFNGDRALVTGELIYVFADPVTQTSRPVPPALREAFQAFEAGQPMVQVTLGSWSQLSPQAHPIRKAVFVEEQHIPADLEWDAADETALHALAVNRFGLAIATGRLVELGDGVGKIGRMAVVRDVRGGNVGKAVLQALIQGAKDRGLRQVILHAQASAIGFYQRCGFQSRGERFEEAGIAHQEMILAL